MDASTAAWLGASLLRLSTVPLFSVVAESAPLRCRLRTMGNAPGTTSGKVVLPVYSGAGCRLTKLMLVVPPPPPPDWPAKMASTLLCTALRALVVA